MNDFFSVQSPLRSARQPDHLHNFLPVGPKRNTTRRSFPYELAHENSRLNGLEYSRGWSFSVLENKEEDGTGAGLGTYGWSGYHNTHFWIDPENRVYGLFMSRAIEFDFGIKKGLKRAFYSSGVLKNHLHDAKIRR